MEESAKRLLTSFLKFGIILSIEVVEDKRLQRITCNPFDSTLIYMENYIPIEFKDSRGRWKTQSLFYETTYSDDAIYTMKAEDTDGRLSFRRIYLEISDPTEYRAANELVGGWEHWQVLCSTKWFSDFIDPIREELEVKLRSEAILQTYLIMSKGDKSALPAAKFFTEGGFLPKRGKGRPSNDEVQAEARKRAAIQERLRDDAQRLGISVVVDNDN